MSDLLLNRVEDLERRLRRWRLATFVLAVLLACSIAIGGTMNLLLMLELPDRQEMLMRLEDERARAMAERERAEQALRQADLARQQQAAKQQEKRQQ